jgi:hypothetical protein
MPFVMLKTSWPGTFRRTITTNKRGREEKRTLKFEPGKPVEISVADAELLREDIGRMLLPVDVDSKGRPRVVTDDVIPAEDAVDELATADV